MRGKQGGMLGMETDELGIEKKGRMLSIFRSRKHEGEGDRGFTPLLLLLLSPSPHFPHSSLARATDTQEESVCPEYQ